MLLSTMKKTMRFNKFVDITGTLLLLLGLVGSHLVAGSDSACQNAPKCTCSNFIMDCRSQSLTEFPKTISSDIKAIYLNDNDMQTISQIPQEAELQTLVLTHNKIRKLSYDAFDNLDNLKILHLSNNSISSIADDIFEWNPLKLEVLYLDGNQLEFIQHFLFYDLEELTDLYLQNNNLTFIHPHAFLQLKNLRNLRLDGNKLHTFNHKWIEKLQSNSFSQIRFDDNPWSCDCAMTGAQTWLQKEKQSKWFIDVTTKYPIKCTQPSAYSSKLLTEMKKEDLDKNCDMPRITGISSTATINLGRDVLLRCVYDKTKFPIPTMSWTAPNKDVYRLNTAGNFDGIEVHQDGSLLIRNLSKIDNGTYTCNATNVKGTFSASTNITVNMKVVPPKPGVTVSSTTAPVETPDAHVLAQAAKNCPIGCQCVSRHIDCAGDGTKPRSEVPDGIPKDAVTISLASNDLKRIHSSDFSSFKVLEELRIDDNTISYISPNAFAALAEVTTLTLSQNELSHIEPGTFASLESLNVLVLDKNKLTKINDEMFGGLKELQWLYIRHNLIQTISERAFKPLEKIKFIHLESNQIGVLYRETITALTLQPIPTIKKLFVDDNAFSCDCHMKDMRSFVQDKDLKAKFPDLFGDGIKCSSPPEAIDMELSEVEAMLCEDTPTSTYPGVLFGGLILGIVLTIILIILWRVYGRRSRAKGRSYNYSNLNGTDEAERSGLTDNLGTSGTEAFV